MVTRRVALGVTGGHDYAAFLPFTCLLWRDRIGYIPSVFMVGLHAEWNSRPRTAVVVKALQEHGIHMVHIDHIPGVEDPTISQSVRQHAAAEQSFNPDDVLIPSDADLLPIRKEFYHQHDPEKHAIGLYYFNGYEGEETWHFPACHMSMRVGTWREVMGLDVSGIRPALERNFAEYGMADKMAAKKADPQKNWGHVWFTDELNASKKIIASKYYPGQTQKIPRDGHPPKDRLDRAAWPDRYDVTQYTDVHSIRPIWNEKNWPRFRPIIEQTMPNLLSWADKYIGEFRVAMQS